MIYSPIYIYIYIYIYVRSIFFVSIDFVLFYLIYIYSIYCIGDTISSTKAKNMWPLQKVL